MTTARPNRRRAMAVTLAASLLPLWIPIQAGESRIELTDGSVIAGELIAIEGGRYLVRSATLGEVSIPESSIRVLGPAAPDRASEIDTIADIQNQLAQDPGLMEEVAALQNDPEIQAVLADPELTRLILAGDMERLRADPRIQELMSHPALRTMVERLMGR